MAEVCDVVHPWSVGPDRPWAVVPAGSVPALFTDQMREVDRIAVDELGIGLVRMMELAGHALAEVAHVLLHRRPGARIAVLAGGGGNGGGGLVAARHLRNRGHRPAIVLDRPGASFAGVPAEQLAILASMGVHPEGPPDPDLVVDALIGYGVRGDPGGRTAELIEWANAGSVPVLSLDGPSGLDLTTGRPGTPTVAAAVTLTLALPKRGLLHASSRRHVGRLLLADIGIPPEVYARLGLPPAGPFGPGPVIELDT